MLILLEKVDDCIHGNAHSGYRRFRTHEFVSCTHGCKMHSRVSTGFVYCVEEIYSFASGVSWTVSTRLNLLVTHNMFFKVAITYLAPPFKDNFASVIGGSEVRFFKITAHF